MESPFSIKEKHEAFAAGWFCGYWRNTTGYWKRRKINRFTREHGHMGSFWLVEFMLGYTRGGNDRKLMEGEKNESVQSGKPGEATVTFEGLARRFGNPRSQREN